MIWQLSWAHRNFVNLVLQVKCSEIAINSCKNKLTTVYLRFQKKVPDLRGGGTFGSQDSL